MVIYKVADETVVFFQIPASISVSKVSDKLADNSFSIL